MWQRVLTEVLVILGTKLVFASASILMEGKKRTKYRSFVSYQREKKNPAEEELSRTVQLFLDRYGACSPVLTHKDMLCSLCSDMLDLAPHLEEPKKTSVLSFTSFVERGLMSGIDASVIAVEVNNQLLALRKAA